MLNHPFLDLQKFDLLKPFQKIGDLLQEMIAFLGKIRRRLSHQDPRNLRSRHSQDRDEDKAQSHSPLNPENSQRTDKNREKGSHNITARVQVILLVNIHILGHCVEIAIFLLESLVMQILVIKRMEKPHFHFFQDLLIMIVLEPNS